MGRPEFSAVSPLSFDDDGVQLEKGLVSHPLIAALLADFDAIASDRAGRRGYNISEATADLIGEQGAMGRLATRMSGKPVRPVRILLFDKTPQSNWGVPWHQDRSIAVKAHADVEGFGPWSVKGGVVHVEPPVAVLAGMVTLRLFVDDCPSENGPLEIALGSHRHGRVPVNEIAGLVETSDVFAGVGEAGDVLALRTLVIHSSKRAVVSNHRRVLHVDYAAGELPPPLEWKYDRTDPGAV